MPVQGHQQPAPWYTPFFDEKGNVAEVWRRWFTSSTDNIQHLLEAITRVGSPSGFVPPDDSGDDHLGYPPVIQPPQPPAPAPLSVGSQPFMSVDVDVPDDPLSFPFALPVDLARVDIANVFTQNQQINKTRPELQVQFTGATTIGRVEQAVADTTYFTTNLSFDGTNWNLDDTSKVGAHFSQDNTGRYTLAVATAGANPRTLTTVLMIDGVGDIPQFGGQLIYPATQNNSSNVNALDDYKEGTWTPSDNSGAGLVLTVTSATFTKIGRVVHVMFDITYPATANGANTALTGLPYALVGTQAGIVLGISTSSVTIQGLMNGGTGFEFVLTDSLTPATNAQLSAARLIGGGTYFAAT